MPQQDVRQPPRQHRPAAPLPPPEPGGHQPARYAGNPPPRDPTRIWFDEATTASAQARRTEAAQIAVDLLGDCSGTPAGIAARLVELAEPIANWIRDGTRPAVEPEPDCTCRPVPGRPHMKNGTGCQRHFPADGSLP